MADVVVLAPHMDDETLGCGGVLAAASDPLVVFGMWSRDDGIEVDQVATDLGFRYLVLYDAEYEARMPGIDRRDLVGRLEEILAEEIPERVYIPSPSYHQDHVVMFEAGLAATRPLSRKGYLAHLVAAYEYPGSAWGYEGRELDLNHYVDITPVMDIKLSAVSRYNEGSQRGRAIIDPTVVTGWARLRGAFVGVQYAEAFRLLRMVESIPR